jgi:hypothetical protein
VEHNLARFIAGMRLITHAHPAMAFLGAMTIPRRHGVGKGEESRGVPALRAQLFQIEILLVFQQDFQTFPANVAGTTAVNGVTHLHVVGRDALGNGPGSPARQKKPAHQLLLRPDFGKSPVPPGIEVDLKGFVESGVRSGHDSWPQA